MALSKEEAALKSLTDWWRDSGLEFEAVSLAPYTKDQARLKGQPASDKPVQGALRKRKSGMATPELARAAIEGVSSLEALEKAMSAFEAGPLKDNARNTVFSDGTEGSDIMLIGEGPGRDEDIQGKPFVGRSGQLLDRMLPFIGLRRSENLYISNILPWRPPGNRTPDASETALCLPFIERHIAIAKPKLVILCGGVAAQTLLKTSTGIMKLRGSQMHYHSEELGVDIPAFPILHPAYLLRRPQDKRLMWQDLLKLETMMSDLGIKQGDFV